MDLVHGGGTVERTRALVEHLNKINGVHAKVITTDIGLANQQLPLEKENMYILACIFNRWYLPFPDIKTIYSAVKWSDVIHLMNHWTVLNALVYLIAKIQKKPFVFCPAGALEIYGRSKLLKTIYNGLIGKGILKNASKIIAITKQELDEYQSNIIPERIQYIPNGVDTEFKSTDENIFLRKFNIPDKEFILFVGRLNEIKGPDLLLKAFIALGKKYQNINLVLSGPDDGMEDQLKTLIKKHKLGNKVFLTGYLNKSEKNSAYMNSLLLAIPSRKEAMSLVALEAAIHKKAVLMTTACGFTELEKYGGALEVPASINGIESGLSRLLSNREKLHDMGIKANQFIRENYSWSSIVKMYIDCYQSILEK